MVIEIIRVSDLQARPCPNTVYNH